MISHELSNLNEFDRSLGTPSAQSILRLFIVWERLQKKQIMEKTGFSESQVYTTLQNLLKIGFLEQESRGLYKLAENLFTKRLSEAYMVRIRQNIGQNLYYLSKNIDTAPLSELEEIFKFIVDQYEPILEKEYTVKLSSLAGHLIDRSAEE